MADKMGIKTEGFDAAVRMMKVTAPKEAQKTIKTAFRFSTNKAKARIKAVAPMDPKGRSHIRSGKFYAPHALKRKGVVSRARVDKKRGVFSSQVRLHKDAFYGWILNVGRYLTGGTVKDGKPIPPLQGSGWIDKAIDPKQIADVAVKEFTRRFGK